MRIALQQFGWALAITAFIGGAPTLAQQSSSPPAKQDEAKAEVLPVRGELRDVDVNAKTLVVVTKADGTGMKFSYTDDTEIIGADRGLSGFATNSGAEVIVHYSTHGTSNVATKIEVSPKK